jgi:biofilm protein TabA
MALFGSIETVQRQAPTDEIFATAWQYVTELMTPHSAVQRRIMALSRGASEKHALANGVIAIEQVYDTKLRADSFFETHRKYIDVQILVAGEETMEVTDVSHAIVREPYQEERDLIKYQDVANASLIRLSPGDVAIYFPNDVHMGALRTGANSVLVRKSVLKLPVAGMVASR